MNIVAKKGSAAASAPFDGRDSARYSLGHGLCCVLLGGALCASGSALAGGPGGPGGGGPGGPGGPGDGQGMQQMRRDDVQVQRPQTPREAAMQRYEAHQQQRGADARAVEQVRQTDPRSFEGRAEEQRRMMQNPDGGYRPGGRMTPDERRDLRRQINEAGQDIYANPPRH